MADARHQDQTAVLAGGQKVTLVGPEEIAAAVDEPDRPVIGPQVRGVSGRGHRLDSGTDRLARQPTRQGSLRRLVWESGAEGADGSASHAVGVPVRVTTGRTIEREPEAGHLRRTTEAHQPGHTGRMPGGNGHRHVATERESAHEYASAGSVDGLRDRIYGRVQGQAFISAGAVAGEVGRVHDPAVRGQPITNRVPHGPAQTDAVQENDREAHALTITQRNVAFQSG